MQPNARFQACGHSLLHLLHAYRRSKSSTQEKGKQTSIIAHHVQPLPAGWRPAHPQLIATGYTTAVAAGTRPPHL